MHLTYLANWGQPGQASARQLLHQVVAYHPARGYTVGWIVSGGFPLVVLLTHPASTVSIGSFYSGNLARQPASEPVLPPGPELLSVCDLTRDLAGWCPPPASAPGAGWR